MSKNYYDILGVKKDASESEIKRAFRKKAMESHPDKHKGDASAEAKFKEVNEAYQVLGDKKKRQQYDTFGSAGTSGQGFSGFEGFQGAGGAQGFDFSEIFRNAGGGGRSQNVEFDLGDLFGAFSGGGRSRSRPAPEPEIDLDNIEIAKIPLFDLILGTKLSFSVDGKNMKLTIPELTKPGTKFKIKGKGHSQGRKKGDLYIKVEAVMPKNLDDNSKKVLEHLRDQLN